MVLIQHETDKVFVGFTESWPIPTEKHAKDLLYHPQREHAKDVVKAGGLFCVSDQLYALESPFCVRSSVPTASFIVTLLAQGIVTGSTLADSTSASGQSVHGFNATFAYESHKGLVVKSRSGRNMLEGKRPVETADATNAELSAFPH
jgi:hypothetical protein